MISATAGRDTRPLRKDAERNRRLILHAAAEAFAERGLDVGFEEIARRAGVGVGTVYRRFPDREVLVDALFHQQMEKVVALAQAALDDPDPWSGLCGFLVQSLEHQASDRGMATVLATSAHGRAGLAALRDQLRLLLEAVVQRAVDAGDLRADIEPLDLAAFSWMISSASTTAHPDLWRRYLVLMLDGLREQRAASTPLPLRAPDEDGMNELLHTTLSARYRPPT